MNALSPSVGCMFFLSFLSFDASKDARGRGTSHAGRSMYLEIVLKIFKIHLLQQQSQVRRDHVDCSTKVA